MASSRSRFHLPDRELTWRFSRSSGPGGQHVNTTDTRVELSWTPATSEALTDAQKDAVARHLRHRLAGGTLTVVSSQYRSQHRNREAARVRLEELVAAALVPRKKRRATKPSRASVERRLASKRRRSQTKRDRSAGWD
ncbi:MAG TPA: alternative ribosome rescue aminoacyl-tRNA hydrolase ArfB [Aeromicrobium sp.]|nr:alternative ribosome rescue aminoacyl-tRNA hydrolase ArfB [Aeromicrobium sp.]